MFKSLILASMLYPCLTLAQSNYQIDLILFANPNRTQPDKALSMDSMFLNEDQKAINLKGNSAPYYSLLPKARSQLNDAYYQLSHRSPFQVLGHYSWIQPANNQNRVSLPPALLHGWQVLGTVCVRQSNYYLFDADLKMSSPEEPQSYFRVSKKQRLKGKVVYFLDNPQVGMLVEVHPV